MSLPFLPRVHQHGCGDPGAEIPYSLALTNGGSLSLPAASAPTASRRLATFDFGVKLCSPTVYCLPFSTNHANNANYFYLGFDATTGCLRVNDSYGNNVIGFQVATVASFRDPSAHYLVHIEIDTTQVAASDRVKIWVNGVLQALTGTFPGQNYDMAYLGNGVVHYLSSWNGYPASVAGGPDVLLSRFVYAAAIIPVASFGYFNRFGVFVPRKYSGAAGYILDFADPLNLGKDVSGNGRHFTASGLTVANQVTDSPTHGYPAYTPLAINPTMTLSDGNLTALKTGSYGSAMASILLPTTGKWYWEGRLVSGYDNYIGIARALPGAGAYIGGNTDGYAYRSYAGASYKVNGGTLTAYAVAAASGDVVGVCYDADAGTLRFAVKGVLYDVAASGITGRWYPAVSNQWTNSATGWTLNFGQRAFAYAPPGGYKALSAPNLPCPAIKTPDRYFTTRLISGGASVADLPWNPTAIKTLVVSKRRDGATDWRVNDSLRPGRAWATNTAAADFAEGDGLVFTEAGYTIGANAAYAGSRVDECFRASRAAGFDMLLVNHVNGVADVVPHAVGGPIDYAWVVPVGAGGSRRVFHRSLAAGQYLLLNSDAVPATDAGWFASSAVNLTLGASLPSGQYAVYAWRAVPQFSAFEAYTGNGAADGAFIPLDFTPGLFIPKRINTNGSHFVFDAARSPTNPASAALGFENVGVNAEETGVRLHDRLSNGLKYRVAGEPNYSGHSYVYAAWAAVPGKFARAR